MIKRRKTRVINLGGVLIGGEAPISVQSMTNTDTKNVESTLKQINELINAGCEIVRIAVPDKDALPALKIIRNKVDVPLVADIHFNYYLALESMKLGVDGIRINPGNIGGRDKFLQVISEAKKTKIPVRIGVNAGSLEREVVKKHGGITAEAMVESALKYVKWAESANFEYLKLSLKASDVPLMIEACRILASQTDYPFHLGVTEAGTFMTGTVKSSLGIGILLAEGIGDTIRVSLTGNPVKEVQVGFEILKALGLRKRGVELISCPTCGRCQIDLSGIAAKVEERVKGIKVPIKVAVMGCCVNGPGEARQADVGIAGGKKVGVVFRKGKIIARVPEEELVTALLKEIDELTVKNKSSEK